MCTHACAYVCLNVPGLRAHGTQRHPTRRDRQSSELDPEVHQTGYMKPSLRKTVV